MSVCGSSEASSSSSDPLGIVSLLPPFTYLNGTAAFPVPSDEQVMEYIATHPHMGINKLVSQARNQLNWQVSAKRIRRLKAELHLIMPASVARSDSPPPATSKNRVSVAAQVVAQDLTLAPVSGTRDIIVFLPASMDVAFWSVVPPSSQLISSYIRKAFAAEESKDFRKGTALGLERSLLISTAWHCAFCNASGRTVTWATYTFCDDSQPGPPPQITLYASGMIHCGKKKKCVDRALAWALGMKSSGEGIMPPNATFAAFPGVHVLSESDVSLRNDAVANKKDVHELIDKHLTTMFANAFAGFKR